MNTVRKSCLLFVCLLLQNVNAEVIRQPPGLKAGDAYHLAFITSGTRDSSSTDIVRTTKGSGLFKSFLNNIVIGDAIASNPDASLMRIVSSAEFTELDNNLYWQPQNGIAYENQEWTTNPKRAFGGLGYRYGMLQEPGAFEFTSQEVDPQLIGLTFAPAPGSPASGTAKKLATITDVLGNWIEIDRSFMFWEGDFIQFSNGTFAIVDDVSLSWEIKVNQVPAGVGSGTGIKLIRNGVHVDDIGAEAD